MTKGIKYGQFRKIFQISETIEDTTIFCMYKVIHQQELNKSLFLFLEQFFL